MKKQEPPTPSLNEDSDDTLAWDEWQSDFICHKGSCTVRCGRQVGKSTSAGKRISKLMLDYNCSSHLVIAPAQRQSGQLFLKVMSWLEKENQKCLYKAGGYVDDPKVTAKKNMELKRQFEYDYGIYNEIPTKTTVILKKDSTKCRGLDNQGSICYALPAGKTGVYLRTFALDFLHIDEAAYVPETVYTALKPMLAVSAKAKGLGWETFLSTPFGKGGFFFHSHHSDDYKQYHVNAEDCPRIGKDFLRKEKARMTKAEYRQEWQGEFCDEWNQFFNSDLLKKAMTFTDWNKADDYMKEARYYLGVDFAGYGGDENAFVICQMLGSKLKIVKCFTTERISATDTIGRIVTIDGEYKFSKIFIDDGGIGSPIGDLLTEKLGRKIFRLNNASKRIAVQGEEKKKGILKEDLYSNTLMLLETGKLELINDLNLLKSMKGITFEYRSESNDRKVKIWGKGSHLTEGLIRACWCLKERGLSIFIM